MELKDIQENVSELDEALDEYRNARRIAAEYAVLEDKAKLRLIEVLEQHNATSHKVLRDGVVYSASRVVTETVKVDEEGLKKALGRRYSKFTKRVFDKTLLEEGIDDGTVKPEEVVPFLSTVKSRPYIRFSGKEAKSE